MNSWSLLLPRYWNYRCASSCSAMKSYTFISLMCISFSIPFPNQLCHPADSFIKEIKYTLMHISTQKGLASWKVPHSFKFSPSDVWELLLSPLKLVLPFRVCTVDLNELVSLYILKKMYYFFMERTYISYFLFNKFLSVYDTEATALRLYWTESASILFSMRLLTIASSRKKTSMLTEV